MSEGQTPAESDAATGVKKEDESSELDKYEMNEVYNEENADLTIISSDEVQFKVHSFFLMAASPVFRGLISTCKQTSKAEIELTDETLERADILRMLLDLACGRPLKEFDAIDTSDVLDLIHLAQKYDCPTLVETLRLLTSQPMADSLKAFNRFYYACALDDADAAHHFFPLAAKLLWGAGRGPDNVKSSISGASMLDITAMGSYWIDRLPRKYFLSLLRASRLRLINKVTRDKEGKKLSTAYTWDEIADDFKRQVTTQGESYILESVEVHLKRQKHRSNGANRVQR